MSSTGEGVIDGIYYMPFDYPIQRDRGELSAYDDTTNRQLRIQLMGYEILDRYQVSNGEFNITILEARTPLLFNCYIISNSPTHYKPNTQLIGNFLDSNEINDILLRSSHKASGTAIRRGCNIHCHWEDKSINFTCNDKQSNQSAIIPIITADQLLQYERDSLLMLYEHHRCLRSDRINECMNYIDQAIEKLVYLQTVLPSLLDRTSDVLLDIKEELEPVIIRKLEHPQDNSVDTTIEPILNLRNDITMLVDKIKIRCEAIDEILQPVEDLSLIVDA